MSTQSVCWFGRGGVGIDNHVTCFNAYHLSTDPFVYWLKVHSSPFCAWLWVCLSVGHRKTLEPRRLVHAIVNSYICCQKQTLQERTPIGRNLRKNCGWTARESREMTLFLECYCSWISVECKWAVIIGTTCGSCFIAIIQTHDWKAVSKASAPLEIIYRVCSKFRKSWLKSTLHQTIANCTFRLCVLMFWGCFGERNVNRNWRRCRTDWSVPLSHDWTILLQLSLSIMFDVLEAEVLDDLSSESLTITNIELAYKPDWYNAWQEGTCS